MRDTDKTLSAFVTVAVITLITLVATIGVCNRHYQARHNAVSSPADAGVVDTDTLAKID